jgi:hypothetical protein
MFNVPYIYRRVATRAELTYYLKQFATRKQFNYSVIYFSFHGYNNSINLEGEPEESSLIKLQDLLEINDSVFEGRYVHFSSCRTMLGSKSDFERFQEDSKALVVSGYSKSVNSYLSAVHDVALIGEYLDKKQKPAIFRRMEKRYAGLEQELGFKYYPNNI